MKILVYNDIRRHIGGAETFAHDLIEGAREKGHTVEFISFREYPIPRDRLRSKIYYVWCNQLIHNTIVNQFQRAIQDFQPDVIHCHNNYQFTSSITHAIKLSGVPALATIHDYDLIAPFLTSSINPLQFLKRRQFRKIMQVSHRITSPTRKLIRQLRPLDREKFAWLPLFVDFEKWPFQAMRLQREPHITFLGRIIEDKGIFVLLEAMKKLVKKYPELKLTYIGGGGDSERLKMLIQSWGLEKNVQLTGYIDFEEVLMYLNRSRVHILSSIYQELFGLVGIEVQALGLPLVAADTGGISEWCLDGETGLLYSKNDPEDLADKISLLLDHPELGEQMAKNAFAYISKHYSRENCVDRLVALYEACLESSKDTVLNGT